jgi:hypothetical protein
MDPKGPTIPKISRPIWYMHDHHLFCSAFASPNNCCATTLCKEQRLPCQTRFHVDPSATEWTSKPETYWAPLDEFLVDPQVSPILRPSQALKALTPSTNWPGLLVASHQFHVPTLHDMFSAMSVLPDIPLLDPNPVQDPATTGLEE